MSFSKNQAGLLGSVDFIRFDVSETGSSQTEEAGGLYTFWSMTHRD